MDIDNLKKELESILLITKWSPTDTQLSTIAKKITTFHGTPTISSISKIVLNVIGTYDTITLEGVDNSDLTTLLTLATKILKND